MGEETSLADVLRVVPPEDIKYRGAVSFEVKPEENQLPEEVLYTAKQVLTEAFIRTLERI